MKHFFRLYLCLCTPLIITSVAQHTQLAEAAAPNGVSQSQSDTASVEEQIKQLERTCTEGVANTSPEKAAKVIDKCEADDIVTTDAGGRVTNKAQDKALLSSGDAKYESLTMSDMKVRVYGNVAVVTGSSTGKLTFKGHPYSGTYRATDVWVKRNGSWQLVAQQDTKIEP